MIEIGRILFPVDFSARCRAIVPFVKAMAEKTGSRVTLLYAIYVPSGFYAVERAYPITLDTDAMTADARNELFRFYGAPESDVDAVAGIGDPAMFITDYARENKVGLIMMATHGYGRFRGLLLGSVAAKVLHDAECPVWTAVHTEDPAISSHAGCNNILCALDLRNREGCLELLRHAVDFASLCNATVRLVHAVPDALPGPDAMIGADYRDLLMQAAREEIDKLQAEAGTRFEVCLGAMPVGQWVCTVARNQAADLVIIGRGRLHAKLGRLRTQAYSIIRESPCPVLSF
jgi:nucleotide-binding universal stress UspA family protein